VEYKLRITYEQDDNILITSKSNKHLDIQVGSEDGRLSMVLTAREDISLLECFVSFEHSFEEQDKIFCNGYQSWTASREYGVHDKEKGLVGLGKFFPANSFTSLFGDYSFYKYTNISGKFHGYTYGYTRRGDSVLLVGSLSEKQGFTIVSFEPYRNRIKLARDVEGISLRAGESFVGIDAVCYVGGYDQVFDRYFATMNIPKPKLAKMYGYTSWYNYFGKIDSEILERDLESLSAYGDKVNIFQIDDGYQSKVGDWLTVKQDKFPQGMKYLADKIHSKGYLAGLWLAPTLAQKDSEIVRNHPDWLITKPNGKPMLGNVGWGGAYILDTELPAVREYLRQVFSTIVGEWGFDMVKLDFLYSACLVPRGGKSRGQIMCETMEFLRECVGDKLILGCGVPLGASFGLVDMCRTGCDVDLTYHARLYNYHTNQEIVSTQNSINNTLFRRHLNGRAFVNDPDVFFARNTNLKFGVEQKQILAKVNSLCGGVLFVSDNVAEYDQHGKEIFASVLEQKPAKIISVDKQMDNVCIKYTVDESPHEFEFCMKKGKILKDN